MPKKIYLFIIPCCLIISEADACHRLGHVTFHNQTPHSLHLKIKRVWNKDLHCSSKPEKKWSDKEKKRCKKKLLYTYDDITISPRGKTKGICWEVDSFSIVDFNVTYKYLGSMHAGPQGKAYGYWHNVFNTSVLARIRHGGDQKRIKSSGCREKNILVTCGIVFKPVHEKRRLVPKHS